MAYEFIHSSMFGSYHEPCELLEESGDRCKIRYVDPYSEETHEAWIHRDCIRKVDEMRNLLQYPITKEEVLQTLERLRDGIQAEEGMGDLRPYILLKLMEALEKDPVFVESAFRIDANG